MCCFVRCQRNFEELGRHLTGGVTARAPQAPSEARLDSLYLGYRKPRGKEDKRNDGDYLRRFPRPAWCRATMRLTRTPEGWGLNPPPSVEAQLILRALLIGAEG